MRCAPCQPYLRRNSVKHFFAFLLFLFILPATGLAQTPQADKQPPPAPPKPAPAAQAPSVDSDEELTRAVQSSGGSETQLIANLEAYLNKYPKSAQRGMIEAEIFKLAVKLHDRPRAIAYAERSIAADANNIEALTQVITILRDRRAPGDLEKAASYADQLVKAFESVAASSIKPKRVSAAQWQERKNQGIASVYLMRGRVLAELGRDEAARADLQKSYATMRLAGTASTLGDLAEKRKAADEAIDYYTQAFVIALITNEELDLKSLRRKLAQSYTAKYGSEKGLGDRILKAHDEFNQYRDDRFAKLAVTNINEGATEPLQFKLTRLDGSKLELANLRGKAIVLNFWATWCGPCLTEMPMFEKTAAKYKDDPTVTFLAITTDEDRELVAPFLKQHKFTLPIAYADYLDEHFGINSIPTTVILDTKGQVAFRQSGFNPGRDFVADLSEKIEAAKKR